MCKCKIVLCKALELGPAYHILLFGCFFVCLFVCLSVCLSVCLFVCVFDYLYPHVIRIYINIYIHIHKRMFNQNSPGIGVGSQCKGQLLGSNCCRLRTLAVCLHSTISRSSSQPDAWLEFSGETSRVVLCWACHPKQ